MQMQILVWVSFPCTEGSAWQNHNWARCNKATREENRSHWTNIRGFWPTFQEVVLPHLVCDNIHDAWEWPSTGGYWNWGRDKTFKNGSDQIPFVYSMVPFLKHIVHVHGGEHDVPHRSRRNTEKSSHAKYMFHPANQPISCPGGVVAPQGSASDQRGAHVGDFQK